MPQLGSDEKPFMVHPKGIVSKESRFRKGFNKKKYSENYDRIFNSKSKKDKAQIMKKVMGNDRAAYNLGSYVSVQEFERHCGLKTVRPNAQSSGGEPKAVAIAIKVSK